MQQYDSYKDSGVKWLGEIPSHWELCRFKNLVSLVTTPSNDRNKIGLENIESGSGKFTQTDNEFEGNGVHFQVNDVVYGKLRPYLQKVWLATFSGNAVGDFFVFRVNNRVVEKYLQYLMLSRCFTDDVNASTYGAKMPRVSSEYILTMRCTVPSKDEQIKIVTYLDTATAKIDAAIAQQQKMIDLLNERKQIIINRAVTKGLNPNAKMKDSGVEWIGEVPEGWEVNKFKNLYKTRTGITFTKAELVEFGERVISYGQIHSKENWRASVNPDLIRYIPTSLTEGKISSLAEKGDFLFADTSEDFEGCGNNVYIDTEGPIYAGYHTILAKCNNSQCGAYLAYLFASTKWRGQIRSMVNGVKVYSITQSIIKNASVILPSIDEQKEIAEYIKNRVIVIDKAIKSHNQKISLLQERKQIIINEVVTGKIKVV